MSSALSEVFAAALRDGRTDWNERFERARHQYPQLQGEDVLSFLRECVDSVAVQVARVDAAAVTPFVSSAYDAALVLCGQKLVGSGGRFPIIEAGWKRVLPVVAALLVHDPARIIQAVSNALHRLATSAGTRPEEWISSLERLGPRCTDVESFLRLGQVLAWHAGLAHLRAGALAAADQLPPDIAVAAVGAKNGADWTAVRARLNRDAWFDPAFNSDLAPGLRVVKEAGAFRGLGGLFLLPPQIAASGEGWLVQSAGQHWYLAVDTFGATFHRATAEEWNAANHELQLPAGVRLTGAALTRGPFTFPLPIAGPMTSIAVSGSTIAVTSTHTHSLAFIALG
jgi:hypothetical protein